MEQIKQIIAEIERLRTEIPYHENAWSVLNKLEVFINSLPAAEEQPSAEVENLNHQGGRTMTDQEIIYKAIREVVNTDKPAEFAAHNSTCYTIAKYVCEELREELKPIPAEQSSEELEKEIESYLITNRQYAGGDEEDLWGDDCIRDAIKYGANWQKEKMMESAIDAKIINDEMMVECEQGCLVLDPLTYPIGQKLKILIIKEDEQ